jgi:hypothetical protein
VGEALAVAQGPGQVYPAVAMCDGSPWVALNTFSEYAKCICDVRLSHQYANLVDHGRVTIYSSREAAIDDQAFQMYRIFGWRVYDLDSGG